MVDSEVQTKIDDLWKRDISINQGLRADHIRDICEKILKDDTNIIEVANSDGKFKYTFSHSRLIGDSLRNMIHALRNMNGDSITFRMPDTVELKEPVDCDSPTDIFDGGELTLNCQIKQSDYEKLFNMLAYGKQNPLAPEQFENSEKHLKQRIKYAKTPMERKMYEKQLNALYKKRKRK